MRRFSWSWLGMVGLGLLACSAPPALEDPQGAAHNPIYGGSPDTTDTAVGALLTIGPTESSECSGTVIAQSNRVGFFLTAAHCVVQIDSQTNAPAMPVVLTDASLMELRLGSDYLSPTAAFGVIDATIPSQYDGNVVSDYDVAVVRFAGMTTSVPQLHVMSQQQDTLKAGTNLKIVGYGMTDTNMNNSLRNTVQKSVNSFQNQDIIYDQSNGQGLCEGDSGGPALFNDGTELLVAGINSWVQGFQGQDPCTFHGASVRASFHQNFISTVFSSTPAQLTCSQCALASIGTGNACNSISLECADTSTQCGKYAACIQPCTSNSCLNACASSQAAGFARYNQYISCACNDCSTECQSDANCAGLINTGGSGGAGGSSGASGTAGSSGTGGLSGTAGTSGTAGVSGTGGVSAGAAGSSAGTAGSIANGGTSGAAAGTTGSGASAGTELAPPTPASKSSGDKVTCSCSVPGASSELDARVLAGALGLGLLFARRRNARV